jgi:hypothetical protein
VYPIVAEHTDEIERAYPVRVHDFANNLSRAVSLGVMSRIELSAPMLLFPRRRCTVIGTK